MSCEVLKVSSYLASLAPRCLKFGQNEGPTSQFCFSAEKKLRLLAPVLGSSKRGSFEHPSGSSSLIFGHLVHVQIRYYHSNNAEIEKHDCSIYILLYKFSWGKLRGTRNSFFSPYSTSSFIPLFQLFPKNGSNVEDEFVVLIWNVVLQNCETRLRQKSVKKQYCVWQKGRILTTGRTTKRWKSATFWSLLSELRARSTLDDQLW